MTQEEILRMAREAGFVSAEYWPDDFKGLASCVERFAALVAAAEREACAKVCDARYMGDNNREDMEARRCAEAIRARGQA